MSNILVIPDSHANPKYDNSRMLALGNYIIDTRPDNVVHLGDLADMPSLSSYDEGTGAAWGRLYKDDIASGVEHQEYLWRETNKYNGRRAKNKKGQYLPNKVFLVGNHEERTDRFINANPVLSGTIDFRYDLRLRDFWGTVVEYKVEHSIGGISFCHYFPSGLLGRPISGVQTARTMCQKLARSAVQGHTHVFAYHYQDRGPTFPRIECWSAGCYTHPAHIEGWNLNSYFMYQRGVLLLRDVQNGVAEGGWEWLSQSRLQSLYL